MRMNRDQDEVKSGDMPPLFTKPLICANIYDSPYSVDNDDPNFPASTLRLWSVLRGFCDTRKGLWDLVLATAGKRIRQAQERPSQPHRLFLFLGKARQVPVFRPVNRTAVISDRKRGKPVGFRRKT